jgi:hypothetical protein
MFSMPGFDPIFPFYAPIPHFWNGGKCNMLFILQMLKAKSLL